MNARYHGNPKDGRGARLSAVGPRADIRGCFDNIDHTWLVKHVPMDKTVLQRWLRAGYLEGSTLNPTTQGTPQGGIISPVLANLALNGLDDALTAVFKTPAQRTRQGEPGALCRRLRHHRRQPGTAGTPDRPSRQRLPGRSRSGAGAGETKVTHLTDGYDFLGQNIRRYNKKLLIKPSRKNVKAFLHKVRELIRKLQAAPQGTLLETINPVITGWAGYHRHVVSQEVFKQVDRHIWYAIWQWAKRRHPNKASWWVRRRYFHRFGLRQWLFAVDLKQRDTDGHPIYRILRRASSMPIERHRRSRRMPTLRQGVARFCQTRSY